MSIKVRSSLHSLVIIAVLFFSAIGPTIVYADGGTDTPPTGSEPSPEQAARDTGQATPSSATSHEKQAPSLKNVPDNTTVQVVNAEGQAEPLATQTAAEAIATSDPIWCPAGQGPTPGANGCTTSFSSFNALLTFLAANASFQGAGTIYVQQGNYSGGESSINFNNFNLGSISNANLTIQGGWNTSTNTVDLTTTSNFSNVPIVVGSSTNPWGGSLTINNLALNFNSTGSSGTGLTLNSQSDINLSNVTVMNSATGAGAELTAGGNVTIKNSKFDRNKTAGAIIRSKGSVAISDTSFSNPANGRRQITGLDIVSDGSVSLFNVLANTNREAGATINAGGRVTIVQSSFSDTKAMKGSAFVGYGLQVVTPDAIDLDTVTANTNFLWGASLNAGGDVTIANSIFNANSTESPGFIDDTGLLITSGGNVSIDTSKADDNRLIGATINAAGDVAISNSSFSNNKGVTLDSAGNQTFHGYGVQVVTPGNITFNSVIASNNTLFGAHLEAGQDVNILNSDFSNQTSGSATDQTGRGLEVISGGIAILDTVTVNNNQTFGANVQAAGGVFLDTVTATGNGTDGVDAKGSCATLFLIGGTYSNNGQYGLNITDLQLNQSGAPVFAGNGAGDIFQNPTTCVFPTAPVTPPVGGGTGSTPTLLVDRTAYASPMSAGSIYARGFFGDAAFSNGLSNMSLNAFLANASSARNTGLSVFTGNYAYVYSKLGMQIFAYSPTFNNVAMVVPH